MKDNKNYIIKFLEDYDKLYYSEDHTWTGVPKEKATRLTHKEARRVSSYLKSMCHCKNEIWSLKDE